MNFIDKIKNNSNKLSLESLYQYLCLKNYRGQFVKEEINIKNYVELLLNKNKNNIE